MMLYGRLYMLLLFYGRLCLNNLRYDLTSGDDDSLEDKAYEYHLELMSALTDDQGKPYEYLPLLIGVLKYI